MPEQTELAATAVGAARPVAVGLPAPDQRWRCGGCGNLTRFDVVRTSTTREFWHVELSGEPQVEESETLDHVVRHVVCRWCGRDDAIEIVARPGQPDGEPSEVSGGISAGGPP